jgi:hypothetical protein
MLRATVIAFLMFAALTSAQARHRVYVARHPAQPIAFNPQPNAVMLCPWVALSVPPDTKPGDITLGICPPRSMFAYQYPPHVAPH